MKLLFQSLFSRRKVYLHQIKSNEANDSIIFVHGLFGDSTKTWKGRGMEFSLPEIIKNDAALDRFNIYSFSYDSSFSRIKYDFREIASLLYSEIEARIPHSNLYFIAHSMGGLIVQQYIVDQIEKGYDSIFRRLKGIIYLSVPFDGSVYGNLFSKLNKQVNTLKVFSKDIVELKNLWMKFFSSMEPFPQLLLYGAKDGIVSRYSAKPIHVNGKMFDVDECHSSICKVDRNSTVYLHIKQFLMSEEDSSLKIM